MVKIDLELNELKLIISSIEKEMELGLVEPKYEQGFNLNNIYLFELARLHNFLRNKYVFEVQKNIMESMGGKVNEVKNNGSKI